MKTIYSSHLGSHEVTWPACLRKSHELSQEVTWPVSGSHMTCLRKSHDLSHEVTWPVSQSHMTCLTKSHDLSQNFINLSHDLSLVSKLVSVTCCHFIEKMFTTQLDLNFNSTGNILDYNSLCLVHAVVYVRTHMCPTCLTCFHVGRRLPFWTSCEVDIKELSLP